jgi:hypothetical protein
MAKVPVSGFRFTLEQILANYPQEEIDAMLRRIVLDPGIAAVQFVALLSFFQGSQTKSSTGITPTLSTI